MIDIHTHLYFPDFDLDRDEAVERARKAGVDFMVSVGTSPEDNRKAIGIAETYAGVYASVGLHPHFFNEPHIDAGIIDKEMASLRALAGHEKVVAIGECGLDYFSHDENVPVTASQREYQRAGFLAQIALAEELKLPLILHTRPARGTMDAYEEMARLLENVRTKVVLHCYQGDAEMTKKFLKLPHVFFSFTATITYPLKRMIEGTKDDPQESIRLIPIGRMFVETDCPFLPPQEHRGERNEPAFIAATAEAIARTQGISLEALDPAFMKNTLLVFGKQ